MKKYLTVFILLLFSFTTESCVMIDSSNFILYRGMPISEFYKSKIKYQSNYAIFHPDLDKQSNYDVFVDFEFQKYNYDYQYYLFKNGKLYYWGPPYKFHRNENLEIRISGELTSNYFFNFIQWK